MGIESGFFQDETVSRSSHFLFSRNETNEFKSREPRYWRNSPSLTWKIVGSAVTKNLPDRPGDRVTSTFAHLTSKSLVKIEYSLQTLSKFLHAGHHGAKLKFNCKFIHNFPVKSARCLLRRTYSTYNSIIHSPCSINCQLSSFNSITFALHIAALKLRRMHKLIRNFCRAIYLWLLKLL